MARPGRTIRRRQVLLGLVAATLAAAGLTGRAGALEPPATTECDRRPDGSNTGPAHRVTLRTAKRNLHVDGQVLENKEFFGTVDIVADDVTIRNSIVHGSIRLRGNRTVIDHVAASGISIQSGTGHVVQYANLSGGADGIHLGSNRPVYGTTIRNNYIHDLVALSGLHVDGIQVRGSRNLSVVCNNIDLGPYKQRQNGAIYLEWVNGGNRGVVIDRNWLNGGGNTLYVTATNLRVTYNRFGRNFRWAVCRMNDRRNPFVSAGNVWDNTGGPVNLCGQG